MQTKFITLSGALMLLSGCGTMGIGSSEYACSGIPDKPACKSVQDVYKATENSDGRSQQETEGNERPAGKRETTGDRGASEVPIAKSGAPVFAPVVLPDGTVPVRAASHVMRIWIAPYETTQGDLVMSGYLYTEVVPRAWQVGLNKPETNRLLTPLEAGKVSQHALPPQ